MTSPVQVILEDEIAIILTNNPPVNALSHAVRAGLQDAFAQIHSQQTAKAIVICCEGRSFFAGADIREFGKPPQQPYLPDLINEIEASPIPVIASIHGTALGGGLEVALGAHYRVAVESARFGLPEVSLGLLPGAGGTQRLTRIVPVEAAIEMITSGKMIGAAKALSMGLIDHVSQGTDTRKAGIEMARAILSEGNGPRPISALSAPAAAPEIFDAARAQLGKKARGQLAPQRCVDAIQAACELPFAEGLARERALFMELMQSDQRAALIHAFFSERTVSKLPEVDGVTPRDINAIGVIGGGTMGAGIATNALLAGLPVTLIERDVEAVERARATVSSLLAGAVKRGKISQQVYDEILSDRFRTSDNYADLATEDLVIEAVFESMEVKQEVFTQLDTICKPGAILASNTSYLDLNAIAAITNRPQDVIGLHFFSPAHVMRLLEVVVGDATAPDVTATAFAFAKTLKKIAVRAGVCDGFIGNRILSHYNKAIYQTVLAGASPFDVDTALTGFGLAMGPFAVSDLAGLDIGWANRKRLAPTRDPNEVYPEFIDRICELGRFGRKTGRGFYVYDEGAKAGRPDPEVEDIIAAERTEKGIQPRQIGKDEIVDRYMAAMVNEAARIVEEGIALRPLDVDVTLMNGYGYPRWRGGPMHYADTVGLSKILEDTRRFQSENERFWQPAPLLEQLVAEGRTFANLNS